MNVYVMANEKKIVNKQEICLQDIADIFCTAKKVENKLNQLAVAKKFDKKKSQKVVDLYPLLCQWMEENPDCSVEFVGATKVLVEYQEERRGPGQLWWNGIKVLFACGICFFGACFTIMAFHNDIGIGGVFAHTYQVILGGSPREFYLLELSYSVGLAAGIIIFFNHLGGKKISKDPTPVEVAMYTYEQNVNQTIMQGEDKA